MDTQGCISPYVRWLWGAKPGELHWALLTTSKLPRCFRWNYGDAYLFIEVGFGELQRVEQGVGGGELHVVAGLLLAHALDDGGQDLVGALLELLGVLKEQQEATNHKGEEITESEGGGTDLRLQSFLFRLRPNTCCYGYMQVMSFSSLNL